MLSYEELLEQHSAELRLSRLVGGRGGLSAIVRAGAELTGKVTALFDLHDRLIARAGPEGFKRASVPPVARSRAAVPAAAEARKPVVVPADPVAQLYRRQLLGEIFVDDAVVGWLVVLEHPTPLRAIDAFLAMRMAEHLGREFLVQRRIASVAWNARASLARQLLRGTCDQQDLRSSGEYLGVDISARRVLAYVLDRDREDVDDEQLAVDLEHQLRLDVLAVRGSEGTVLLVEAPRETNPMSTVAHVKTALNAVTSRLPGNRIAGVSSVSEPSRLRRAYREAREVAHCVDRFVPASSQRRVLAVDDLGPARLFLANSDAESVRGYVDDVLGPLLAGDPRGTNHLLTLQKYFDTGRSVRAAAARLGVHENTVRLRFERMHDLTGLNVLGNASDQLSVQTALLVVRLQGHPAVSVIDPAAAECRPETA
ncbi:helix-turn-helix domain-containing protein [Saccharopolyspora sp. HNM0986]|uniref:PucR family transcriptional regulator n=1 Tax=Saccharopolyspora galaxeae TaxID=2781241 RepID=UPI00190D8995|nr:helix-turn-helix domain-containing protein [Saccharopolyspora sp. HNM0986]MBK0870364.1 helix-turn-helix domain-containing protein [Saccharopolyspora sp. HNM0986]